MPLTKHADALERLYEQYNRRCYVHPDPLEFLYRYPDVRDREVAGLIAALLAYGRVKQILRSVRWVLDRLGASPGESLRRMSPADLPVRFAGFRHRFQTSGELVALLRGMQRALRRHGSLEACFLGEYDQADETVLPALCGFVHVLDAGAGGKCGQLLPDPRKGSACKRLHLFLRWMVRRDEVDPGGWDSVPPDRLIVPLDTHMHRVALTLGATKRKSACIGAAGEMTAAFRRICPDDPVKYDFALTRLGIRPELNMDEFFSQCGKEESSHA